MSVIYVSGIPRSGSTWAFNVCRLAMWKSYGQDNVAIGYWNGRIERTAYDPNHGKPHAIIKSHEFVDDRPEGCIVIHSCRDYNKAAASWNKMAVGSLLSAEYLMRLDMAWRPYASFIFHRDMLDDKAVRTITAVNICRAICGMGYQSAVKISRDADNIEPPKVGGVDPVTFLHRGHKHVRPKN
jgi:hypothetical protein